jgi:hypothetical protein
MVILLIFSYAVIVYIPAPGPFLESSFLAFQDSAALFIDALVSSKEIMLVTLSR